MDKYVGKFVQMNLSFDMILKKQTRQLEDLFKQKSDLIEIKMRDEVADYHAKTSVEKERTEYERQSFE